MAIRRAPPVFNIEHLRPWIKLFAEHISYTEHAPWESLRSLVEYGEIEVVDEGRGGRLKAWRRLDVGPEQPLLELAPPAPVKDQPPQRARPGEVTAAAETAARVLGSGGAGFTSRQVDRALDAAGVHRGLSSSSSALSILEHRGVVRRDGRKGRHYVWRLAG